MRKRSQNVAAGTLLAAGIGYLFGILTAPKSGRETRRDIERAALHTKHDAEKALKSLNSELAESIDLLKSQSHYLKGTARKDFDKAMVDAHIARDKVREIISAIHEGESENDDLQAAIDDINRSLERLKKYMKS